MSPRRKRARASTEARSLPATEDKHQNFTTWAVENGLEIHNVAAQKLPGRGLGLVVTKPIKEGSRILFIPESAIFKPMFTYLHQAGLERASSQAKLVISSLSHFAAPVATRHIWSATWPSEQDLLSCMPLYWPDNVTRLMPESAVAIFNRQKIDYQRDWLTCKTAVSKLGYTEAQFKYHWMIVNSRSFHWAPPRGGPGYMVMCPFIDYMNHGPTGTGCTVVQRGDGYEMLAQRSYKPGQEIVASYGAHPNEKLLIHYGFIIAYDAAKPSIDDEIRIDKQVLSLLDDETKQQLSDLGYLGPFALVPKTNEHGKTCGWELCFKTQVAIRATYLTCNEWEYFAESGDDLSNDNSLACASKISPALAELEKDITTRISNVEEATKPLGGGSAMIKERWVQIAEGVRWFLSHAVES